MMSSLKHENKKDNYREDITHGKSIGKQISYRTYRRIAILLNRFY